MSSISLSPQAGTQAQISQTPSQPSQTPTQDSHPMTLTQSHVSFTRPSLAQPRLSLRLGQEAPSQDKVETLNVKTDSVNFASKESPVSDDVTTDDSQTVMYDEAPMEEPPMKKSIMPWVLGGLTAATAIGATVWAMNRGNEKPIQDAVAQGAHALGDATHNLGDAAQNVENAIAHKAESSKAASGAGGSSGGKATGWSSNGVAQPSGGGGGRNSSNAGNTGLNTSGGSGGGIVKNVAISGGFLAFLAATMASFALLGQHDVAPAVAKQLDRGFDAAGEVNQQILTGASKMGGNIAGATAGTRDDIGRAATGTLQTINNATAGTQDDIVNLVNRAKNGIQRVLGQGIER